MGAYIRSLLPTVLKRQFLKVVTNNQNLNQLLRIPDALLMYNGIFEEAQLQWKEIYSFEL